jgi:hypothetical protein
MVTRHDGKSLEPNREEDPLDEAIRTGPPDSMAGIGEYAVGCMAALEAIAEVHADDPLRAAQEGLCAIMRLIAGLSPPGSSGPAHVLFAPLLEAVLQMRMGEPPSMLRYGPPRHPSSRPSPPHIILGRAVAAAVVSLLIEEGVRAADAAQLVARRLKRGGAEFRRRDSNPVRTVEHWREQARGGDEPLQQAYRWIYAQLAERIAPAPPEARQELLLRALAQGVDQGMYEQPPPR